MKDTKFTGELLKNSQDQEGEIFRVLFSFKNEHIRETLKLALLCSNKRNENGKNANQKATKNS